MIIKPKHRHVDSAGMVYLPYLSTWSPTSCNLLGLVDTVSKVFGQDPPVRSTTGGAQASTTAATPAAAATPASTSSKPALSGSSSSYPTPPPKSAATQAFENPAEVAKRNAARGN